jgi:hypothetical protein
VQILEAELDRRTNTVQTTVDSKAVSKLASTCHVCYATGIHHQVLKLLSQSVGTSASENS